MNKLTLSNAFHSYFHNKYSFDDFCSIDTHEHYKEIFYSKNTFSPSSKLKDYQRFLNLFIFEKLPINERVVFSYRKGYHAKDAIEPHKHHKYILNSDIKSFFLNVSIQRLKEIILNAKDKTLILAEDIEKSIEQIMNIITYNDILPIGSPSSPLISNAYLFELDNEVEKLCMESNIAFTRYSDDFIFSSNNQQELKSIFDKFQEIVKEYGFTINDKKTKLQTQGANKVVLLGLVLTSQGFITVDKQHKREIEVLLHFYLTDKEKFKRYFADKYDSNVQKVSGLLSHISSIDSFYVAKLKRKYGSFIVNSFIHRDVDVKF